MLKRGIYARLEDVVEAIVDRIEVINGPRRMACGAMVFSGAAAPMH